MHAGYLSLQTHTQYVIFIAFPTQKWLHELASLLRYTYIACLVIRAGFVVGILTIEVMMERRPI
jgi:hypothetical protein